MAKMTGGQALAKSLYLEGVRVIFGLPGVQLYHALDGLAQEPGIRFVNTRLFGSQTIFRWRRNIGICPPLSLNVYDP